MEPQPEHRLAMAFFAKLLPELQKELTQHAELPRTQDEMVALATRYWNTRKHRLSNASLTHPARDAKRFKDKDKRPSLGYPVRGQGASGLNTGRKTTATSAPPTSNLGTQVTYYNCGKKGHRAKDC